jgi:hypothetical protein
VTTGTRRTVSGMARDWETWLKNSIGPSSATEQPDRDRTEKSIRDAIAASPLPSSVRVYAKGSYANNANVRRDSDVDIVVEWTDWMYIERVNQARSLSWADLGVPLVDRGPTPAQFRSQVTQALINHFGAGSIDTSGTKAIKVAAGSSTLDADVVPCFSTSGTSRSHTPSAGPSCSPRQEARSSGGRGSRRSMATRRTTTPVGL